MFFDCEIFNKPLNNWDVTHVKDMKSMFFYCHEFNQDISRWDVSNVEDMNCMYYGCYILEEYKPKFN